MAIAGVQMLGQSSRVMVQEKAVVSEPVQWQSAQQICAPHVLLSYRCAKTLQGCEV